MAHLTQDGKAVIEMNELSQLTPLVEDFQVYTVLHDADTLVAIVHISIRVVHHGFLLVAAGFICSEMSLLVRLLLRMSSHIPTFY